jgi:type II secretory ATPase GspE/PulE/Tfp pilus assembly ATPase PilB-like protein
VCRGTGYLGRISVFEIIPIVEPIQQAIVRKAPSSEIRGIIHELGFPTLLDDGVTKMRAGVTSLEEVMRAVFTATE